MNFQEWLNSRNGRAIDMDGYYGAQCWDSWADFAVNVVGTPLRMTYTGAGGGGTHRPGYACEVYHQFERSGLNQWLTRLGNVTAQRGDVAFWEYGYSATPYSHVAVVIEDRGNSLLCMTQNPGANHISVITKAGLLGYLRPDDQSKFGGGSAAPTNAQQRQAGGVAVNRRSAPNTSSAPVDPQLAAGVVGTFDGWIRGESVDGNDIWFRGALSTNNWFWSGAFTSTATAGLADLNPAAVVNVESNQRQAGATNVNRRANPNTGAAPIDPQLGANVIGTFDGWIRGESIDGNNVWFRGALSTNNWFWSGAFTSAATAGLTDLNPAPVVVVKPTPAPIPTDTPVENPAERIVGATDTNRRPAPNRSVTADATMLKAGAKITASGWITGESIEGRAIWYKISGTELYAWAGAFTKESIENLADLNPAVVIPKDETTPAPVPTSRVSVANRIPNWGGSATGTPVYARPTPAADTVTLPQTIAEQNQPASVNGYTAGRPTLAASVGLGPVNHFVLHHAATTSLTGAVNTLKGGAGAPTATYVVKDRVLVNMVDEADAPWTNGRWTSNMHSISFEMVNEGGSPSAGWTPPSADTQETVAWAMARAVRRWGIEEPLAYGINVFGHRDVSKSATACPGGLDVTAVVARVNDILASLATTPVTPEEPVIPETPVDVNSDGTIIIANALGLVQDNLETIIQTITK
jgi:hypothetical protein